MTNEKINFYKVNKTETLFLKSNYFIMKKHVVDGKIQIINLLNFKVKFMKTSEKIEK